MFRKVIIFIFLTSLIFISNNSFAETIQLTSGDIVEGKIVEQAEDYIRVDTGIGFYVTYYFDEIKKIDGQEIFNEEINKVEEPSFTGQELDDSENDSKQKKEEAAGIPVEENSSQKKESVRAKTVHKTGYSVSRRQEDLLFDIAQNPDAGKVERKWEENRYLDYQVERQVEAQKNNIKQAFLSFKDSMLAQAQSYMEKLKDNNPAAYNLIDRLKVFFNKTVETAKTVPLYVFIVAGVIFYLLFCYPLMLIGQKLGFTYAWMAWIPILNLFLIVRMAGKSLMSFILLFVPIINILVFISLWGKISEYLQKPSILSLLMILPGPNLLVIWYLAFVKTK